MLTSNFLAASILSIILSLLGWEIPGDIKDLPPAIQQELQEPVSKGQDSNLNIGTIEIRAIVANITEVGNRYGSSGIKFTQSKISEVDQALQRLNTFVQQSSYRKADLEWTISGVYELGSVCNHTSYGEKTQNLIQKALEKADAENPLPDYSYYVIVHPLPDCPDGEMWTYEGLGQFTAYELNGRTVYLRGTRISDLSDQYLFHEFGHSLAYQPNTAIGHPDYLHCPITNTGTETKIVISNTCLHIFDFSTGEVPVFTLMAKPSSLSDYSAIEKETIGWLTGSSIITTTKGSYTLTPLEQTDSGLKAIKIPITGTDYTAYISFRQSEGHPYPTSTIRKPSGVIIDITNGSVASFLITNNNNKNEPLQIGVPYRLTNDTVVMVNSITNNLASITISNSITPITTPIITPSCVLNTDKKSYTLGETITYSWKSRNATYTQWQQDNSGKDQLNLSTGKLPANGSEKVSASVIGNPSVTLLVGDAKTTSMCSSTINITTSAVPTEPISTNTDSASINPETLRILPKASFTLTGNTSIKNGSLTVAIVGPGYTGNTTWGTVSSIVKSDAGKYTGVSKTTSFSGSKWSTSFSGLTAEGYYTVLIYDDSYTLIGTDTLWVTFKG